VLVGAVRHHDEDTERATQILDGLGLTCTGGSSRCATVVHSQGLGESDIAPIGERSDTETLLGSQVLVLVDELDVGDCDSDCCLFLLPVAAGVLKPVEIVLVLDLVLLDGLDDLVELVTLVDLDGDHSFDLGANHLLRNVGVETHESQLLAHIVVILLLLFQVALLLALLAFAKSLLQA